MNYILTHYWLTYTGLVQCPWRLKQSIATLSSDTSPTCFQTCPSAFRTNDGGEETLHFHLYPYPILGDFYSSPTWNFCNANCSHRCYPFGRPNRSDLWSFTPRPVRATVISHPQTPCEAKELIPELGFKDCLILLNPDASNEHNNNNARHKGHDGFIKFDDIPSHEGRQDGFDYIVDVGSLSGRLRTYSN